MIASSSVTLALTWKWTLMIYYPGVLELIMMKQINYLRCYYPYQLICWYVRVNICMSECMYEWMSACMVVRQIWRQLSSLSAYRSLEHYIQHWSFYIQHLLVQDKNDNLHGRKMVVVAAGRCIAWLGSSTHRQQTHLTNNNHRDVRRRAQGWDCEALSYLNALALCQKKRLYCFDILFWRPDKK